MGTPGRMTGVLPLVMFRSSWSLAPELRVALAAMILNQQNSAKSVTQWRASAKCLSCAPDKTIEAAFVYLFAANFQATAL